MTRLPDSSKSKPRVLICMPAAKDMTVIQSLMSSVEAQGIVCADVGELARHALENGDVILVSEEMLDEDMLELLIETLHRQPEWSDLPVLLVSAGGPESPLIHRAMRALTNILPLNRPLYLETLTGALRMALRARGRQLRLRELLKERQHREDALRLSEKRYRTLFESIDEGFCIMELIFDESGKGVDYRFLETNPAFERHTGLVDAVGKTARELVPNLEERWPERFGRIARTGVPERFEAKSTAMGRWFESDCFRIGDPEERKVALLFRDITSRKQAEEALRHSERRLRDVMDNMVAMIGMVTPDGALVEANRTALEAANLKSEDVLGKPFEECYWWAWSPDVQKRLREAIEKAAAGKVSRYDEVIRVGEGEFMTIDFMLAPMFDSDGRVSYLISSAIDITERKQSEEELRKIKQELEIRVAERTADLRKQKEILQKLVDNVPAMIALYNAEGVLYINRTALETIGISAGEMKNVDVMQICYPDPEYRKEVMEFMMEAPPEWREFRMVVRDGKRIETSWFNIRLADGSCIGIGMDITERKAAEKRIQGYIKELERSNKLLSSLSSKLTLAEQRERRHLAEILHDDLQQLLVAVQINFEVLSAQLGSDQKKTSDNILSLITQSIQVSRSLTAELSPPVLQQGRLSAAMEWLARWMQEKHGLKIELQTNPVMDPEREDITLLLFQSVRELLFNVVKHAKVKSARIEMGRYKENRLRVIVIDKGPGFDPADVWEKDGAGFGLLSIRERLTMLGGSLEIESAPGRGAVVSLLVPIEITKKKEEERIRKTITELYAVTAPGGKIRVLLADDHPVMREGLSRMLEAHSDIEIVAQASDGEEAVFLTRKIVPDVILMDVSMPKMNGLEATRIIHSEFPHIRIIGLSMYDEDDQAAAMKAAGATAYRSKGTNTDRLIAAIRGEVG